MRLAIVIGILSIGGLIACSGAHNRSTDLNSTGLGMALTGGTSSGGPAARLKIYSHCVANDGILTLDLAGDLSALQAQVSTGLNACAQAWSTFNEYQGQSNGVMGLVVASGNQQLFIGAPISSASNSGPHVNFSGTWTDGVNVTPMVCSLYDGYQSSSGCASGETEILRCPALGTSICIQEN